MAPMISGAVRRYLRPRSGRMAAGCASVNGMRAPSARPPRARGHADAEVRADPVRSRAECQIDATAGTQLRGIDLQHVQSERVRSGVLLAHVLPAVEPPAHGSRLMQGDRERSEEHTSELQSPCNLVCRLLLEKKKKEITVYASHRAL